MAGKRQYTEDDKAVTLAYHAACGGNTLKTARDCKIPEGTIRRWLDGGGLNDAVRANARHKKGDLADACESLAWKLLSGMDDEAKIAEAPINQLSTAFGTLVDKSRLLRGQSTENLDVNDARTALHEKWASFASRGRAAEVPEQPDGEGG